MRCTRGFGFASELVPTTEAPLPIEEVLSGDVSRGTAALLLHLDAAAATQIGQIMLPSDAVCASAQWSGSTTPGTRWP